MSEKRRVIVYALPYVIIMSLQYSFAKDGLLYADPLTLMAVRYFIAAFAAFLFSRRFKLQLNKDTVLVSLFTFLSALLWILGLRDVSPAESAVLHYTMPLFSIPLSALILKEKSSRPGWIGALVGFVGVAVYGLALGGSGGTVLGATFTVCSAAFWALWTVYCRKMRDQNIIDTVSTQFLLGAILFSVLAPFNFGITVTPEFLVDLGFLSIIAGFCSFVLWNAMLRREKVGRITTIAFAIPSMTTLIQAVETGTVPSPVALSGIGLMFLGIYVSRSRD